MQAMLRLLSAVSLIGLAASGDSCGTTGDSVEQEPNNLASQANALSLDGALSGSASGTDSDWFVLDVPADYADYKVTFSAKDEDGRCFVGLDPALSLFGADGKSLLGFREDGPEGYCPSLSFVPTPGCRYYLELAVNSGTSGAYTLTVARGGAGSVGGLVTVGAAVAGGTAETGGEAEQAGRAVLAGGDSRLLAPVMDGQLLLEPSFPLRSELERERWLGAVRVRLGMPARLLRPILGGRFLLVQASLPSGLAPDARQQATRALVSSLKGLEGLRSAAVNAILAPSQAPNDPDYATQWDMKSYPGINMESAWALTQGSSGSVVGIIDTGNDADHPDLQGKWVPGFDFIADVDNAGDGDGPDQDPDDALANGHGTHVAGTAAASTDNGTLVAGVGWNTRYMPLRVCGRYGCVESDIMDALWYAAGYAVLGQPGQATARVSVVNLSLGGADICHAAWQAAIDAAIGRGVLVVAAAGNSSTDASGQVPAGCPNVIAVGATTSAGARASFSNYGPMVDIMAPGDGILSTRYGGGTMTLSGTSMAAPHVAGLLSLIKDLLPALGVTSALEVLGTGARPVSCLGVTGGCGLGLVDAGEAVAAALTRSDDSPPTPILVQVVNEQDPGRVFTTTALNGQYLLEGLPAGTYRVQAGDDLNGNGILGETGEPFGVAPGLLSISSQGDDLQRDVQVSP